MLRIFLLFLFIQFTITQMNYQKNLGNLNVSDIDYPSKIFFLSQKGIPYLQNKQSQVVIQYYDYSTQSNINQETKIAVFLMKPSNIYLVVQFYPKQGKNFLSKDLLTPNVNVIRDTFSIPYFNTSNSLYPNLPNDIRQTYLVLQENNTNSLYSLQNYQNISNNNQFNQYSQQDIENFISQIQPQQNNGFINFAQQTPFERLYNNNEELKLFLLQHQIIKKYSQQKYYQQNLTAFLLRYGLNSQTVKKEEIPILQYLLNFSPNGENSQFSTDEITQMKRLLQLFFQNGIGYLLSGINKSYSRTTQQIFEGKKPKIKYSDLISQFSKKGAQDYFIGDGSSSPASELITLLFFGSEKDSFVNYMTQYVLRYFNNVENLNNDEDLDEDDISDDESDEDDEPVKKSKKKQSKQKTIIQPQRIQRKPTTATNIVDSISSLFKKQESKKKFQYKPQN